MNDAREEIGATFASNMRRWRKINGYSLHQLVKALKIAGWSTSEPALSKIENGIRGVSIGEACIIADALFVSVNDLVTPHKPTLLAETRRRYG